MTAIRTEWGTGYSPSAAVETFVSFRRTTHVPDGTRTGIVFAHGFGGHAIDTLEAPGNAAVPALLRHLANCGWPVVGADLGYDNWGNATGQARYTDAKNYLQGAAIGAKPGKIIAAGYSHGGLLSMAWARSNPTLCAGLLLLNPACNLLDAVTNNRDNAAASVNAASPGGAYSDSRDGPTMSPLVFAGQLAGIPTLVYNATDDAMALPQYTDTVVAAIGASCTRHHTVGGHGEASLATINRDEVAAWLYSVTNPVSMPYPATYGATY